MDVEYPHLNVVAQCGGQIGTRRCDAGAVPMDREKVGGEMVKISVDMRSHIDET